ncbi:MAG: XdhC family protein [Ardenticatenaceae bacterium]|nr:XdhC family protein [Ardenticatenaceae bacterium]
MSNSSLLHELLAAQAAGDSLVLATIVKARGSVPRHAGTKMLVYADGRISGTIGGGELEQRVIAAALEMFANPQPRLIPYALVDPGRGDPGVCGGEMEVYMEIYQPPATVLVVGCGHVGQAVAGLAHWLGYRVIVTDDRSELASPANIPEADVYLPGSFGDVVPELTITANTYVVVVTRNVQVDQKILPLLAPTRAPYIGVMGSRRRWAETQRLLLEAGLPEADLVRFHSPIGLELNAEDPQEIAVSIMAEIIKFRRGTA